MKDRKLSVGDKFKLYVILLPRLDSVRSKQLLEAYKRTYRNSYIGVIHIPFQEITYLQLLNLFELLMYLKIP